MSHWLLKTEPETYSWNDLVAQKRGVWDGVRNYAAAKNLRAMKKGEAVFIYHTGKEKAVVGVAKVIRTAYPDPKDPAWINVDVSPVGKLARPIDLEEMKEDPKLADLIILRQSRLSVAPVSAKEWGSIIHAAKRKAR